VDFGEALHALKNGKLVRRDATAWDGTWLVLIPGSQFTIAADRPLGLAAPHLAGDGATYRPHLDLCTFCGGEATLGPWSGTDADLLAEDWIVMPDVSRTCAERGE